MDIKNASVFQLESGINKGSETTKNFFKRVNLFVITKTKDGKVRFRNVWDLNDYLECSLIGMETNGNWSRIETQNSVINIWKIPEKEIHSSYKDVNFEIKSFDQKYFVISLTISGKEINKIYADKERSLFSILGKVQDRIDKIIL